MTDTNKSGIKYPKQLAVNEASSRRQIEQLELFNDEPDPLVTELKKSLYTFNVAYSTIFDGLSNACTMLYDKKWQDAAGEWHDIIGRKDDKTETHYRLFAPEAVIKQIFTGPYEEDWPEVKNQLLKIALKPEIKKMIISEKHSIIDAPIRVIPWYENDDIGKFTNLSPRRNGKTKEERETQPRETGKARGRIVGFAIEFFKPLFEPLLRENSKNTTGEKYLLTPPYFQLNLNRLHNTFVAAATDAMGEEREELRKQALLFTDKQSKKIIGHNRLQMQIRERQLLRKIERVTPMDIRKFYLALSLKDNHKGEYITVENFIEFVDGIWPRLIRIDRNGNKALFQSQYNEAVEKINCILEYLHVMARNGNMDGGQIVPLEIITEGGNGEKFTRETNKLRIRCIKNKTLYSRYTLENLLEYFTQ
jgi:hypothetical protein